MKSLYMPANKNIDTENQKIKSTSCPDLYQLEDAIKKPNINHMAAGNLITLLYLSLMEVFLS